MRPMARHPAPVGFPPDVASRNPIPLVARTAPVTPDPEEIATRRRRRYFNSDPRRTIRHIHAARRRAGGTGSEEKYPGERRGIGEP
jgi:hypothetical protein